MFVRMWRRLDERRISPNGPIDRALSPAPGSEVAPGSGGRSGGGWEK
jgi:hypothetical protein